MVARKALNDVGWWSWYLKPPYFLLVERTPWSMLFSIFFSNCSHTGNKIHGTESQCCPPVEEITRILWTPMIHYSVQEPVTGLYQKVKVKVTLVQALRLCTGRTAYRGSRGIALHFHDHGTRSR